MSFHLMFHLQLYLIKCMSRPTDDVDNFALLNFRTSRREVFSRYQNFAHLAV